MEQISTLILSLLGLGILIFFHELGHYVVARRVGMTVEVFAIGFGRPILQWMVRGVRWQLGWIPFGGYVKIKGSEPKGNEPLDAIPDGFFGKNQRYNRIKVALAGPLVNFALALIFFCIIWIGGGRARPFADTTRIVGYVKEKSALYQSGLRAGDQIDSVGGRPYRSYLSLLEAAATMSGPLEVKGKKADGSPFSYSVDLAAGGLTQTVYPASYLLIGKTPAGSPLSFSGSPVESLGIEPGERLLWLDGEVLYSHAQLRELLVQGDALISFERGGKPMLARAPRLPIADFDLSQDQRDELIDLRYDQGFHIPLKELKTLPYLLSSKGEVIAPLSSFDKARGAPVLQPGDRITAIDGSAVTSAGEIFTAVQSHQFHLGIQSNKELMARMSAEGEDERFETLLDRPQIASLERALASGQAISKAGDIRIAGPVKTKPLSSFAKTPKEKKELAAFIEKRKEAAEGIINPERRALVLHQIDAELSNPMLGLSFRGKMTLYNPNPMQAFIDVFGDTWHTLTALVAGPLSPKLLSGPVGIVQVMQGGFSSGWAEGLFWMALISVNLGLLNLLPIPVLDGGHICFAIYEIVTGRTISPRTMQRLTLPFALALIGFLIWITLQDIGRLFG